MFLPTLIPLFQGDSSLPPIFFLHSVTNRALVFTDLAAVLKPLNRSILLLLDSSSETGVFPYHSIEEMAEAYLESIRSIQPQGPYALCGYSFGGSLAVEIVSLLEKKGEKLDFVGLIDPWAVFSSRFGEEQNFKNELKTYNLAEDIIRLSWERWKLIVGHTPASIKTPVVFFKAKETTPRYQVQEDGLNGFKPYLSDVQLHTVPGDHDTMSERPFVEVMGQYIRSALQNKT